MADITDLSTRHIANIEKGDVNPSFEVLSTLVKALGVSFDAIFDPADEQTEADIIVVSTRLAGNIIMKNAPFTNLFLKLQSR